jgi:hypothetical protein
VSQRAKRAEWDVENRRGRRGFWLDRQQGGDSRGRLADHHRAGAYDNAASADDDHDANDIDHWDQRIDIDHWDQRIDIDHVGSATDDGDSDHCDAAARASTLPRRWMDCRSRFAPNDGGNTDDSDTDNVVWRVTAHRIRSGHACRDGRWARRDRPTGAGDRRRPTPSA